MAATYQYVDLDRVRQFAIDLGRRIGLADAYRDGAARAHHWGDEILAIALAQFADAIEANLAPHQTHLIALRKVLGDHERQLRTDTKPSLESPLQLAERAGVDAMWHNYWWSTPDGPGASWCREFAAFEVGRWGRVDG